MAGYSGTTLAKKLGIRDNFRIRLIQVPEYYLDLFSGWPRNVDVIENKKSKKNLIHFFTKESEQLFSMLPVLKEEIEPDGMIWVSWPKRASKMPTNITEDIIRNYALGIGLVDIKVCAVDEIWSGLKLVIPIKFRTGK